MKGSHHNAPTGSGAGKKIGHRGEDWGGQHSSSPIPGSSANDSTGASRSNKQSGAPSNSRKRHSRSRSRSKDGIPGGSYADGEGSVMYRGGDGSGSAALSRGGGDILVNDRGRIVRVVDDAGGYYRQGDPRMNGRGDEQGVRGGGASSPPVGDEHLVPASRSVVYVRSSDDRYDNSYSSSSASYRHQDDPRLGRDRAVVYESERNGALSSSDYGRDRGDPRVLRDVRDAPVVRDVRDVVRDPPPRADVRSRVAGGSGRDDDPAYRQRPAMGTTSGNRDDFYDRGGRADDPRDRGARLAAPMTTSSRFEDEDDRYAASSSRPPVRARSPPGAVDERYYRTYVDAADDVSRSNKRLRRADDFDDRYPPATTLPPAASSRPPTRDGGAYPDDIDGRGRGGGGYGGGYDAQLPSSTRSDKDNAPTVVYKVIVVDSNGNRRELPPGSDIPLPSYVADAAPPAVATREDAYYRDSRRADDSRGRSYVDTQQQLTTSLATSRGGGHTSRGRASRDQSDHRGRSRSPSYDNRGEGGRDGGASRNTKASGQDDRFYVHDDDRRGVAAPPPPERRAAASAYTSVVEPQHRSTPSFGDDYADDRRVARFERNTRDVRDARDGGVRDVRDTRDVREVVVVRDRDRDVVVRDVRDVRELRDVRDTRDSRDGAREVVVREVRGVSRDRGYQDVDSRDPRDPRAAGAASRSSAYSSVEAEDWGAGGGSGRRTPASDRGDRLPVGGSSKEASSRGYVRVEGGHSGGRAESRNNRSGRPFEDSDSVVLPTVDMYYNPPADADFDVLSRGGHGGGRGGGGRGGRGADDRRGGGSAFQKGGRKPSANPHMGELNEVQNLLGSMGMTDKDILKVIAPPMEERDRSKWIDKTYSLDAAFTETSVTFPSHASWRYSVPLGRRIDIPLNANDGENKSSSKLSGIVMDIAPNATKSSGIVWNTSMGFIRSNHFKIDTAAMKKCVYQYSVQFFRIDREGNVSPTDCATDEDARVTTAVIMTLRDNHPEWLIGRGVGFTYNGRNVIFTSELLPFASRDADERPTLAQIVALKNLDGTSSSKAFKVTLTLIAQIELPGSEVSSWATTKDDTIILALDTPLLGFARWGVVDEIPEWFVAGATAFRSMSDKLELSKAYTAMRGYYAGLKTCMAGLVLVSDMSVSCFLAGGEMINMMWQAGGYSSFQDMLREATSRGGIPKKRTDLMAEAIRNAKVRITHLGHWRKAKGIGPPADSPGSSFVLNGMRVSVAEYFVEMCRLGASSPVKAGIMAAYMKALPNGRLKYPYLPTINIGSTARPVLVPPELVVIPGGQCRSTVCTGEMAASMIKYAAVRPDERMRFIIDGGGESVVNILRRDRTAQEFGLGSVSPEPMAVSALLLPPAKLQFGAGIVAEPKLTGTWSLDAKIVVKPPPCAIIDANTTASVVGTGAGDSTTLLKKPTIPYATLVVTRNPQSQLSHREEDNLRNFFKMFEVDGSAVGFKLKPLGDKTVVQSNSKEIANAMNTMKFMGVNIVLVVMISEDCYSTVKLHADKLGLVSQCVKYSKLEKSPGGFCKNLVLKINMKLGGVNHTLVSRLENGGGEKRVKGVKVKGVGSSKSGKDSPFPSSISPVTVVPGANAGSIGNETGKAAAAIAMLEGSVDGGSTVTSVSAAVTVSPINVSITASESKSAEVEAGTDTGTSIAAAAMEVEVKIEADAALVSVVTQETTESEAGAAMEVVEEKGQGQDGDQTSAAAAAAASDPSAVTETKPVVGDTPAATEEQGKKSEAEPPATQQQPLFQDPPASISWLFDEPCMFVGLDISHGDSPSSKESIAAVVGSVDGRACQYAAHISSQEPRKEIISDLEEAMRSLLETFRGRNGGRMPKTMVVYRDGVGDSQFEQLITLELPAIKGAIMLLGYPVESVKIAMVVCQKGHHTRLVFEEPGAFRGKSTFINPCPGVCVDSTGGQNSIASARLNEFYLNSHVANQGTAKPCKYTLIHDEIGFKISELELLTYWTTYLYARSNKSVSYATPAYYAHWASKRGRNLVHGGGSPRDLLDISKLWGDGERDSIMFFV